MDINLFDVFLSENTFVEGLKFASLETELESIYWV